MRIGVIGTGQMGGMLATAYITTDQKRPVTISNRSRAKAEVLRAAFPEKIVICKDNRDVIRQSDVIFLCVKSSDATCVLNEIAPVLRRNQVLISTNSTISLAELARAVPSNVAKLIPSITQYAKAGILLVMFCESMEDSLRQSILELLSEIGTPHQVPEEELRIYSDITSCGPAFLANWLNRMAQAAVVHGVPANTAEFLLGEMVYGVGKLVTTMGFRLDEIVERVAVPGGITNAGLTVLRKHDQGVFEELFEATATRQQQIARHGHS